MSVLDWQFYSHIFLKIVVNVTLLVIYGRLMGIKRLVPATAFDTISNLVVGAVAGTTLLNDRVSAVDSVIFMVIWIAITMGLRVLKTYFPRVRNVIEGMTVTLIEDGEMLVDNFRKENLSPTDLEAMLRSKGVSGIHSLDDLIIERNGNLSYTERSAETLASVVVDQGAIKPKTLERIGKDEAWLHRELERTGVVDVKNIFCAEWNNHQLYLTLYPALRPQALAED